MELGRHAAGLLDTDLHPARASQVQLTLFVTRETGSQAFTRLVAHVPESLVDVIALKLAGTILFSANRPMRTFPLGFKLELIANVIAQKMARVGHSKLLRGSGG